MPPKIVGQSHIPRDSASVMKFHRLFSLLAALALAGCETVNTPDMAYNPLLVDQYLVDSGDVLRVTVFDQTDLTNTYSVDKAGYVAMPLIGTIDARGRTTHEIESSIATKLRANYLRDPDVAVEIARYRPFFIMGEVTTSGQYSYVAGLTIQQAIAVAGGFTPRANKYTVDVVRQIGGKLVTVRLDMIDAVFPGDTITVRERLF